MSVAQQSAERPFEARTASIRRENLMLECCVAIDHLRAARDLALDDPALMARLDRTVRQIAQLLDDLG